MKPGLALYLFLQDDNRDLRGFANMLGQTFFAIYMNPESPAGRSDIAVVEERPQLCAYPVIGELMNPMIMIADPPFRYVPPIGSYVLPTTAYTDVSADLHALPSLTLPGGGDVTVAISAQLSGCSLCYRPATAALPDAKIIHIQPVGLRAAPPAGEKDSIKLQNILETRHACFAGDLNRPTKVYGGKETGDNRANIILLRRDGKWTLFSQRYVGGGNNTVIGVDMVPLYE